MANGVLLAKPKTVALEVIRLYGTGTMLPGPACREEPQRRKADGRRVLPLVSQK